jgi:hypothetical protein
LHAVCGFQPQIEQRGDADGGTGKEGVFRPPRLPDNASPEARNKQTHSADHTEYTKRRAAQILRRYGQNAVRCCILSATLYQTGEIIHIVNDLFKFTRVLFVQLQRISQR